MANAKLAQHRNAHNCVDITGQRFGRLVVLERDLSIASKPARWRCKCDCGTIKSVNTVSLRRGNSKSCGCTSRQLVSVARTTHGKSRIKSPTYSSWHNMLNRCTNPNVPEFKDYGGRGITVCERWHLFSNFLMDMGERPAGTTIGRINNSRGYHKENCRWKTMKQQSRNRRNTLLINHNGKTQSLTDWCHELGLSYSRTITRLKKKLPTELVFSSASLRSRFRKQEERI